MADQMRCQLSGEVLAPSAWHEVQAGDAPESFWLLSFTEHLKEREQLIEILILHF